MTESLIVGQTMAMVIQGVDQYGNPFALPAPDSAPSWSLGPQATPVVDSLVVAGDGLSAVDTALAPGADVVNVTAIYSGRSFSGSLALSVAQAPPVLSGIAIVPTISGP